MMNEKQKRMVKVGCFFIHPSSFTHGIIIAQVGNKRPQEGVPSWTSLRK
jgi:hypothetical protein